MSNAFYGIFIDSDGKAYRDDAMDAARYIGDTPAMRNMDFATFEERVAAMYADELNKAELALLFGDNPTPETQHEDNAMPQVQTVHFVYTNGDRVDAAHMSDEDKMAVMTQLAEEIKTLEKSPVQSKVVARRIKAAQKTLDELVELFDGMEEDDDESLKMKLPSVEQSLNWARKEAFMLPDNPTQQRKYLLMILHHISELEKELERYEHNQSTHGATYEHPE